MIIKSIINALKGVLIGIANTIPGVSGGTIAVVTGIYDRMIGAVGGFFREHGGWKANLLFLGPVVIGVALGILGFARIVDYFLQNYPEQTALFFMGLIAGSVPFLVKQSVKDRFRWWYLIPFVICLAAVLIMRFAGEPPASEPITILSAYAVVMVLLSGIISAAAMIIPGISGSFILLLIGMYSTFISAASERNLAVLGIFVVGSGVGIVLVAKVINLLLKHFHEPTYFAIIGLVLGSLAAIWPGLAGGAMSIVSVVVFVVGFTAAFVLGSDRKEKARSRREATPDTNTSSNGDIADAEPNNPGGTR